jgi:hypothetical protein
MFYAKENKTYLDAFKISEFRTFAVVNYEYIGKAIRNIIAI